MRSARKTFLAASLALLLACVCASSAVGIEIPFLGGREETPAMRGRKIATELGCFACHGPDGRGGFPDPTSPSGEIPGWEGPTVAMYVLAEEEIAEWILEGKPRRESENTENETELFIPMPAYADDLGEEELNDLVAYFKAVSGWDPDIPDEAYEGRKICERLGCFGCHGPSGMGGVLNPGSFKGHIPAWDGEEYAEIVKDEDELREWILTGRIERFWKNPAARFFLERQKTQMPAYRDILSEEDLDKVVAYIERLREE